MSAATAALTARALRWQSQAVCALETSGAPELWTPDRRPAGVVFAELQRMCGRCPVRRQCARAAVDSEADTGLYAGVWIPERSQGRPWLSAMDKLRVLAEGVEPEPGTQTLGVPA